MEIPNATSADLIDDTLVVELTDARMTRVPLSWYPRLLHSSPSECRSWRLIGNG